MAVPAQIINDRFRLLSMLGSGSFGYVYRAWDELLEREVALKFLNTTSAGEICGLIDREVKAATLLHHRNIATIYALGTDQGAGMFIVMECIQGRTLRSLISEGHRLPLLEVLDIFSQLCSALEHAHANGVLHRDIKPENIMLAREDNSFIAKLVDFGLAKVAGRTQNITKTGAAVGTPAYMSPEQCKGFPCDARSDVFGLGACLYETLMLSRAHPGDDPVAAMWHTVNCLPPPFTKAAPGCLIPSQMEAIVFSAIATDPEARIPSAAEFRVALEQVRNCLQLGRTLPQLDLPIASGSPASARSDNNTAIIKAIASLASVLACAALFVFIKVQHDSRSVKHKDPSTDVTARVNPRNMLNLPQLYLSVYKEPLLARLWTSRTVRQLAEMPKPATDRDRLFLRAKMLATCGCYQLLAGDLQEARRFFLRSLSLLPPEKPTPNQEDGVDPNIVLGSENRSMQAELDTCISSVAGTSSRADVIQLWIKRLELERSLFGQDDLAVARSLYTIGTLYSQSGDCMHAAKYLSESLPIFDKHLSASHPISLFVRAALGPVCECKDADRYYLPAVNAHPTSITAIRSLTYCLRNYGTIQRNRGKFAESESLLQRCLALEMNVLKDTSVAAVTLERLALLRLSQDRSKDAADLCEQALVLCEGGSAYNESELSQLRGAYTVALQDSNQTDQVPVIIARFRKVRCGR